MSAKATSKSGRAPAVILAEFDSTGDVLHAA